MRFQGRSGKEIVVPERAVSDPGMDMEDKMIKEEMLVKRYERQNEAVPVHISTLKKEENKREQNFYDEIIKRERERSKAAYDKEREFELLKKTRVNQYVSQLDETVRPNQTMTYDLGTYLWRHLKRVAIPVFSGSKKEYENWKASFMACIDQAPATGEYKLMQLQQYLTGDALKAIEGLGHSVYEIAKERLDRKFDGRRRQLAIYLEELENIKPIRNGKAKDLENFADVLDITIVNLREAGRYDELGNGTLYIKLKKKIPQIFLSQYHR